jgi:hypothetical protein
MVDKETCSSGSKPDIVVPALVDKETVTIGGLCKDTSRHAGTYLQICGCRLVSHLAAHSTSKDLGLSFQVSTVSWLPWDTFSCAPWGYT